MAQLPILKIKNKKKAVISNSTLNFKFLDVMK